MPGIARLSRVSNAIELDFVERVFTPKPAMELGDQLCLSGLSVKNTVSKIGNFGIEGCRPTVHNWVQKADLEPRGGRLPEKIVLGEPVIKIDGERFWFFAAGRPDTNRFPHVGLYSRRITVSTKHLLRDYNRNTGSKTPNLSSTEHRGCRPNSTNSACTSGAKHTVIGTRSNVLFLR